MRAIEGDYTKQRHSQRGMTEHKHKRINMNHCRSSESYNRFAVMGVIGRSQLTPSILCA
jgi:hypothetical protein